MMYNMSTQVQAQRNQFMNQLAYDHFLQRGRFSYDFLYSNYKNAFNELIHQHYSSGGLNADYNDERFLEDLYRMNNDFMGLGLAANCLSSGMDNVSHNASYGDNAMSLFKSLQQQNGDYQKAQDMANGLSNTRFDGFASSTQQWIDNNNQRQRDYVGAWREKKWAAMDQEEAARKAGELNDGEQGFGMPLAVSTSTDPPGGKGKNNLVKDNTMRRLVRTRDGGFRKSFGLKDIHISLGFRFGNTVFFDIRINSKGGSKWEKNFPGRSWLPWNNKHSSFRFSILPYRVYQHHDPQSYYREVWTHGHIFIGGYAAFVECPDYPFRSHK